MCVVNLSGKERKAVNRLPAAESQLTVYVRMCQGGLSPVNGLRFLYGDSGEN